MSAGKVSKKKMYNLHQPNLTVHVAKAASLALLCVVKTTSPIDRNVAFFPIETRSSLHAATSTDTAKLEESIKHRAVVADIVLALFAHEAIHIVWSHLLKKLNVLVRMKLRHLRGHGGFRALHWLLAQCDCEEKVLVNYIDLKKLVDVVVHD